MSQCAKPVARQELHDYFARDLPPEQAEQLEEHVFGCDVCARNFDTAGALATGLRSLIPPVITHQKLEQLERAGQSIRLTPVQAGVPTSAEFSPGISLLVHALRADLSGVERVDLEVCARDGQALVAVTDAPVDIESGEVLVACQRHYQHDFADAALFRLWAVRGGEREALGDYVVEHIW